MASFATHMKKLLFFLSLVPLYLKSQSLDGFGTVEVVPIDEIHHSTFASEKNATKYLEEELPKYKKNKPVRFYQWFDYKENDTLKRYRREYDQDYFMYDEWFTTQKETGKYKSVRHSGKHLQFEFMDRSGKWLVAHGKAKIYDREILQATVFFHYGRPARILMNHYYASGKLHFVRDIRSNGPGQPFLNVAVHEYYKPDGSVFENPITEDGSAIIILNEEGEEEDLCECMDQDVMEWGAGYLYPFLGKFYYLLEEVYLIDRMECCWE